MDSGQEQLLGQDFLTWLWYSGETAGKFKGTGGEEFSARLERRVVVQGVARGVEGDLLETASVSGASSELREARLGLATGKKVSRALLCLELGADCWEFSLRAGDFGLSSFKTPALAAAKEKDDDPEALLFEKIYLLEKGLGCLDALYAHFLRLRLGAGWAEEAEAVRAWMRRGA